MTSLLPFWTLFQAYGKFALAICLSDSLDKFEIAFFFFPQRTAKNIMWYTAWHTASVYPHIYMTHCISSWHEDITSRGHHDTTAQLFPELQLFAFINIYFYIIHLHKCIFTVILSQNAVYTLPDPNTPTDGTTQKFFKGVVV